MKADLAKLGFTTEPTIAKDKDGALTLKLRTRMEGTSKVTLISNALLTSLDHIEMVSAYAASEDIHDHQVTLNLGEGQAKTYSTMAEVLEAVLGFAKNGVGIAAELQGLGEEKRNPEQLWESPWILPSARCFRYLWKMEWLPIRCFHC